MVFVLLLLTWKLNLWSPSNSWCWDVHSVYFHSEGVKYCCCVKASGVTYTPGVLWCCCHDSLVAAITRPARLPPCHIWMPILDPNVVCKAQSFQQEHEQHFFWLTGMWFKPRPQLLGHCFNHFKDLNNGLLDNFSWVVERNLFLPFQGWDGVHTLI